MCRKTAAPSLDVRYTTSEARATAPLGTLRKTRGQIEPRIWHGQAWHGWVGQAFELVDSGVVDRATANSSPGTATSHKEDDQIVRTKHLTRSCLRVLDQSEPRVNASPLCKEPAARMAQHDGRDYSRVGWTSRSRGWLLISGFQVRVLRGALSQTRDLTRTEASKALGFQPYPFHAVKSIQSGHRAWKRLNADRNVPRLLPKVLPPCYRMTPV